MRAPAIAAAILVSCSLLLLPCRHAAAAEASASASASGSTSSSGVGKGVHGALFLELGPGLMIPLADDEYDDVIDPSFKLALLRAGFIFRLGPVYLGPELSVDFTPGNVDSDLDDNLALFRMRLQLGARLVFPIPKFQRMRILARLDLGMDIDWGEIDTPHTDDSSTGFAFEFASGFEFMVHKMVAIGFTMGLPISTHRGHFFGQEDWTSLDLDFMIHLGIYPFQI